MRQQFSNDRLQDDTDAHPTFLDRHIRKVICILVFGTAAAIGYALKKEQPVDWPKTKIERLITGYMTRQDVEDDVDFDSLKRKIRSDIRQEIDGLSDADVIRLLDEAIRQLQSGDVHRIHLQCISGKHVHETVRLAAAKNILVYALEHKQIASPEAAMYLYLFAQKYPHNPECAATIKNLIVRFEAAWKAEISVQNAEVAPCYKAMIDILSGTPGEYAGMQKIMEQRLFSVPEQLDN